MIVCTCNYCTQTVPRFDKTRPCVNRNQTSDEIAIDLSLQKEWHKMDISLPCLVPILRQCESLLLVWMAHLKTNKLKLKHNGTNPLHDKNCDKKNQKNLEHILLGSYYTYWLIFFTD